MKRLLAAIRAQCPRGLWAQGVKLARAGAVAGESSKGDEEIVLRVRSAGTSISPTVVLYPADQEWECDCRSRFDACEHVAAAIIAADQAREASDSLPSASISLSRVAYRFLTGRRRLRLRRCLVDGESETELTSTLSRITSEPARTVLATRIDMAVDVALGPRPAIEPSLQTLARVFEQLEGHDGDPALITLDGEPMETSREIVNPLGLLRDAGRGVRLTVVANPDVDEVVADGVARCGDTLRVLGQTEIVGLRLEKLPLEQVYARDRLGELVTHTLPELAEQVELDVQATRLPAAIANVSPRIHLAVSADGADLSVLPTLVYGDPPLARIDGDRMVQLGGAAPIRDRAREREAMSRLRHELNLAPGRRVVFRGADAQAFSQRLDRYRGRAGRTTYTAELVPRLAIKGDDFELQFETTGDDPGLPRAVTDARAVIAAWSRGHDYIPIGDGAWARLPAGWLARHGQLVADLLDAREAAGGKTPLVAAPALAELAADLGATAPESFARLAPLVAGFDGLPAAKLPADLHATLRDYQERGVAWLAFLRDAGLGALLADDMGLGKTIQTLCALRGTSLIVCPTSVLPNWSAEIARFRPELSTCMYHGPGRSLDAGVDVVLTTYAILRIDQEPLSAIEWDAVVLDEAQAIKNPSSQVAKAAFRLPARFRVALSGTPVENRLEELWSLMCFTNRGLLGTRSRFRERFARPIARGEPGAAERLRKTIAPFVLRRLKAGVAPELPERTESVLHVELSESERAVYDAIRITTLADVREKLAAGGNVMAALETLLRLRQAACHAALVPGGAPEAETSTKVRTLIDALDTVRRSDHRALVFSQWTSFLDLIEPALDGAAIAYLRLDGSTRDRGAVVDGFQSPDGPPVLLASLKAGGTGLNLTAADHVFLTDPWWNPAAEDQAADRAHRIGQDRPVFIYRLVSRATVEEKILALQQQKRGLADAALGTADRAANLTREDLMFLLDDVR